VFAVVRAALAGAPLPQVWAPPAATSIPSATDYVGTFHGEDGSVLVVEAVEDGLGIRLGATSARLERDPLARAASDGFLVADAELDLYPLEFARGADGVVVEAFHGSAWFRREGGTAAPPLPGRWVGCPGVYRNDDPWGSVLRILPRKGALFLQWPAGAGDDQESGELIPLPDGGFAVGDVRNPLRVRFEGEADGRAVTVVHNGGRWYRSFESI